MSLDRLEHGRLLEIKFHAMCFIYKYLAASNLGCSRSRFFPSARARADEIPPEIQSSVATPDKLDIYSVTSEGVLERLR